MVPFEKLEKLDPSLPPWVLDRLRNLFENPAHFEASSYGPLNAFLSHLYAAILGFMVKPQQKLRESIWADDPRDTEFVAPANDDDSVWGLFDEELAGNISMDSAGDLVQRKSKDDPQEPDFVIAQAGSSLYGDVPLIVIEVKREFESLRAAKAQLIRYVELFKAKIMIKDFLAVVIAGSVSLVCHVPFGFTDAAQLIFTKMDTGCEEFCDLLYDRLEDYRREPDEIA